MTWQDWALLCAAAGGIAGVIKMIFQIPQWWETRKARKLQEKEDR